MQRTRRLRFDSMLSDLWRRVADAVRLSFASNLKRPFPVLIALWLATAAALAFELGCPCGLKEIRRPEPLTVGQAYVFASMASRVTSTDQFLCIRTNALPWLNLGDWCFVFATTNGQNKVVCVMVNYDRNLADTQDDDKPTAHTVVFDDLEGQPGGPE